MMNTPPVVTEQEWEAARRRLLVKENSRSASVVMRMRAQ